MGRSQGGEEVGEEMMQFGKELVLRKRKEKTKRRECLRVSSGGRKRRKTELGFPRSIIREGRGARGGELGSRNTKSFENTNKGVNSEKERESEMAISALVRDALSIRTSSVSAHRAFVW